MNAIAANNAQQRLGALRPMLIRFARLHLRDDALAEDVVQECLLAAFANIDSYAGDAKLETWTVSILRNKLIDHLRRTTRDRKYFVSATDEDGDEEFDRHIDDMFVADGHWRDTPQEWHSPQDALQEKQFMTVLQACLDHLPERLARIFTLREVLEFETDEICKEVGLTSTNCFVQLYRARMRLRECLQLRWFGESNQTI